MYIRSSNTGPRGALSRDLVVGEELIVKIRAKSTSTDSYIRSTALNIGRTYFEQENVYQDFVFETTVAEYSPINRAYLGLFTTQTGESITVQSIEILTPETDNPPLTKDELEQVVADWLLAYMRNDIDEMEQTCNVLSNANVSQISDMRGIFGSLIKYHDGKSDLFCDINNWDVSNVTNMSGMFQGIQYSGSLSNWDVSNVKDMSYMFFNSSYNQSLNNWDVSNVITMERMFAYSSYNHPLDNWDVSNVTNMVGMFYESSFNHPINSWDVSNVNYMNEMFYNSPYNYPLNGWNVSNVENSENFVFRSSLEDRYNPFLQETIEPSTGTELIQGGGNDNGALDKSAWSAFGNTYGSLDRTYNGEQFIYATPKDTGSGMYQSFATEVGKEYEVRAILIGSDTNRREVFNGESYLTVSTAFPVQAKTSVIAESEHVTGAQERSVSFSFTATSTTSYLALRSDREWHYASARAISVKEVDAGITPTNDNPPLSRLELIDLINTWGNDPSQENADKIINANTSEIIDMSNIFYPGNPEYDGSAALNISNMNLDISAWDVSNVGSSNDFATASVLQDAYNPFK